MCISPVQMTHKSSMKEHFNDDFVKEKKEKEVKNVPEDKDAFERILNPLLKS